MKKYDALSKTLTDENLTKDESMIYNSLILLYNEKMGYSYPSYTYLKKVLRVTRNTTVSKALKSLEGKEYIKREKVNGKNTRYYLLKNIDSITSVKSDTSNENDTSVKSDTSVNIDTTTSVKNEHTLVSETNINSINIELNNRINNKKRKSNKKETSLDKLIYSYTDNEELIEVLKEFLKMRTTIKKPATDRALKMVLNKLDSMTDNDQVKIKILDNSILNNWQSVFPLKEEVQQVPEVETTNANIIDFKIGE